MTTPPTAAAQRREPSGNTAFICVTCGTQYPPSAAPPAHCAICEDERQYVNPDGQQWTSLTAMRGHHQNRFEPREPGLTAIVTEPEVGIGQQSFLIETEAGNVLWDLTAYVDDATVAEIERRGGVAAIAISHPHFYTTLQEWSRALGGVPVLLHELDRPWVVNPGPAVRFRSEDALEILPGLTVVRCGGHFPGAAVLHWAGSAAGAGILLTGDTIAVAADRRWVSFMYSYPNDIPLDATSVRRIVEAVEPYSFARIYGAFGGIVVTDAKEVVHRSAERYIRHIASPDASSR